MDTLSSWRKTQANDLAKCLQLHRGKNGAEIVGHARAVGAWQQLFEMSHATRSALVEMHEKNRVEIVGFGFASFVKKSFAEDEVRNPRPGLNSRIIKSIVDGNSVIATLCGSQRREHARRPAAGNPRYQLEGWSPAGSPGRLGARSIRPGISGTVCGLPLLQDSFRNGG